MAEYISVRTELSTRYEHEIDLLENGKELKNAVFKSFQGASLTVPDGAIARVGKVHDMELKQILVYISKIDTQWATVVFDSSIEVVAEIVRWDYRYDSPEIAQYASAPSMAPTMFEESHITRTQIPVRGRATVRMPISEEQPISITRVDLDLQQFAIY